MSEIIRFQPNYQMDVPTQAVYLKSRWTDDWVLVPELWCSEAVWSMAPSISTASLRYRYGDALESTAGAFGFRLPLRGVVRFYVRIDFHVNKTESSDSSTLTRPWYGTIEIELDEQDGSILQIANNGDVTAYSAGKNHLIAYGLENILARSYLDRTIISAGPPVIVPRAVGFNPGLADIAFDPDTVVTPREGNRSENVSNLGIYVFHDRRTGGKTWSTSDAVGYEVATSVERDSGEQQRVPFSLVDVDRALPTWDQPIESREGSTVFEILNRLVSRQRGLAWRVEVFPSGNDSPDLVAVIPCTFLDSDLTLSEQKTLVANPNRKILAWERDRGADVGIKRSELDRADQVIARGERRTSTATFSFMDQTLTIGWPTELETAYEQASSPASDYPAAAEVEDRQFFDLVIRAADKFKPVYTRFVPADPMTPNVGDGVSGARPHVLMPSDEDEDTPAPHAPEDQRFLPWLALLEGHTYDGDAIDSGNIENTGAKPAKRMSPMVLFRRTNLSTTDQGERWQHAETKGLSADMAMAAWGDNSTFSAQVRVDNDDGALWVSIHDGLNHFIAKTDFTPLATDEVEFLADYKTDMIATLTVPWSQFAEAKYPENPDGGDGVRRMFIELPNRRVDYVAPETVVGIDINGKLLRTDVGGWIRDDTGELADAARIAFAWFGKTRKAISFSTSLINNRLELGDFIVSIGDPNFFAGVGDNVTEDVNSVVTQIRITMPLAEGEGPVQPPIPRIDYETSYGELDPLRLLPRAFQS